MGGYLLTVEDAYRFGEVIQVLPRVPLREIAAREPGLLTPMPEDSLELRLPDGSNHPAAVVSFGIEAWERDGQLYTTSDPADPVLTLNLRSDLPPDQIPAGTQVWLAAPRYRAA